MTNVQGRALWIANRRPIAPLHRTRKREVILIRNGGVDKISAALIFSNPTSKQTPFFLTKKKRKRRKCTCRNFFYPMTEVSLAVKIKLKPKTVLRLLDLKEPSHPLALTRGYMQSLCKAWGLEVYPSLLTKGWGAIQLWVSKIPCRQCRGRSNVFKCSCNIYFMSRYASIVDSFCLSSVTLGKYIHCKRGCAGFL